MKNTKKFQNPTNKKLTEPRRATKIGLLILLLTIFISFIVILNIEMVSAADFDNTKTYDPSKREITITNLFGMGAEIAKIRLLSEPIQFVRPGTDVQVATLEFYDFDKSYSKALKQMEFYDIREVKEKNLKFDYKYKNVIGQKTYPIWSTCPVEEGGCVSEITGYRTQDVIEWVKFNSMNQVPDGTVTIGIFTDVSDGDYVEWIPTFFGVRITEWAAFSTSGLVAYWNFEETGAIINDGLNDVLTDVHLGKHNATLNGTWGRPTYGIVNNAYNGSGFNNSAVIADSPLLELGGNATVSFWVNETSEAVGSVYLHKRTTDNSWQVLNNAGKYQVSLFTNTIDGVSEINIAGGVFAPENWTHVAFTINSSDTVLYVNAHRVASSNFSQRTVNDQSNSLLIGGSPAGSGDFINGTIDEIGIWNQSLTLSQISDLFNDGNGLGYLGASPSAGAVAVVLNYPSGSGEIVDLSVLFNASVLPGQVVTLDNATFNIWHTNTTLFNTTSLVMDSTSNETTLNILNLIPGTYDWNVLGCGTNSTGFVCDVASNNFSFTYGIANAVQTSQTTIFETQTATYNVTFNVSSGTPSANLWLNGTKYTGTGTNTAGNKWIFSSTVQTAVGTGMKNIFWELVSGGLATNTTTNQQNISLTNFTYCNFGGGAPFINFTYKNETVAQEVVNASVTSSTFNFWLGDGSVNKTTTYSNTVELSNHTFCGIPADRSQNVDIFYSYDNSETQQRTYNPAALSLSNSTTNQLLWLLPTSDGIFVTFQVLSASDQPISGATITITRSGFGTIATETTGASGTVNIFLNPNFVYTITATAPGFSDFSATQTFPTTEFTIIMGISGVTGNDYQRGISTNIYPKVNILRNSTTYNFNYTISSSYWILEEYGFSLLNDTTQVARVTDTTSNGGIVNVDFDTGNYTTIKMNYYWKINGTYHNRTASYFIRSSTPGSISGFFERLKAYVDNGIFGIGNFGVVIILFMAILLITGVLSFKFGLNSPVAIFAVPTILIIFFEIVGIMPSLIVPFLASGIMVLVLITLMLREGSK